MQTAHPKTDAARRILGAPIGSTVRVDAPDIPEVHGKTGEIVGYDAPFLIVKVNIEGKHVAIGAEDVRRVYPT